MVTLGYLRDGNPSLSGRDLLILLSNGLRGAVVYLFLEYAIRLAGPLLTSIILVSMVPMTFPFDHLWNHTVISPQLILEAALIVLAAIGC